MLTYVRPINNARFCRNGNLRDTHVMASRSVLRSGSNSHRGASFNTPDRPSPKAAHELWVHEVKHRKFPNAASLRDLLQLIRAFPQHTFPTKLSGASPSYHTMKLSRSLSLLKLIMKRTKKHFPLCTAIPICVRLSLGANSLTPMGGFGRVTGRWSFRGHITKMISTYAFFMKQCPVSRVHFGV
jgi:hypothetical protein